jgi:hypothetical protein
MFNGIEVDMLSLGDADSIIVTKYENGTPHRILIDGGRASDAEVVLDFMLKRKVTEFWAVICSEVRFGARLPRLGGSCFRSSPSRRSSHLEW